MNTMVFYSWQSDLPSKTNRGLIEDALGDAVKALQGEASMTVEPVERDAKNVPASPAVLGEIVIERDADNLPGSPDISGAIFDKINRCAAFVADVSLIHKRCEAFKEGAEGRRTPNPNVLVELGYAVKVLGWDRVILVCNIAYGPVESLPFDIRQRKMSLYRSSPEDTERAPARRSLAKDLQGRLHGILGIVAEDTAKRTSREFRSVLSRPSSDMEIGDLLFGEVRKLLDRTSVAHFPLNARWSIEDFAKRLKAYEDATATLRSMIWSLAEWSEVSRGHAIIRRFFADLGNAIPILPDGGFKEIWRDLRWYPLLLVTYAGGISAERSRNYWFLSAMAETQVTNPLGLCLPACTQPPVLGACGR